MIDALPPMCYDKINDELDKHEDELEEDATYAKTGMKAFFGMIQSGKCI